MEVKEMLDLIKAVSSANIEEFKYEEDDYKIVIKKPQVTVTGTVAAPVAAAQVMVETEGAEPAIDGKEVVAPLVGTFYAAPSEGAEPFVQVGDTVKKGQTIGIVEAMKLMNEVESEYDGVVTAILVENEQMVEYGQPLIVVK
ncbi:acetyl-CoA carboxylase, biotin carboxyl carrier protein [Anaerostipes sp. 992a]|uniref:acetyl-CoA carboxylase biotin carboxyl carrier protein n=1 Tax=Anaerostipes sp. 992a TaxID=1261637 RepID=UPI0009536477|nr:acetyl-CoA carboxylase biotin carboxyl carrier protein [Anaerostipes sp. 992a]OLR62693.1 acetyl-CoA carboxylase, biotin carboxyl carrier protein [Anaerostipes sp. 992a]